LVFNIFLIDFCPMLKKLQQRWKVTGTNLVFIIATFALGGSLCGFTGRKILELTTLEKGVFWVILYIVIITLLWPLCVIVVSIPLGQFPFFKKYLQKIWGKISGQKKSEHESIAIFASGAGSNAKKIIDYFIAAKSAGVKLVVCNKQGAGVLDIARQYGIDTLLIEKDTFYNTDLYTTELKKRGISFIVLAGFLWKVPPALIKAYPNKIVNIHPALLPRHGGKGMYGKHVHEAVIAAGDKESGITIHYADEQYDNGNIIFQAACAIDEKETPDTLAHKIHLLEHQHYPAVIDGILKMQNRS
jgi:formyltetrahydrofolate-dependent phosphoribosylglycinamide formyltransferase